MKIIYNDHTAKFKRSNYNGIETVLDIHTYVYTLLIESMRNYPTANIT